MASPYSDDLRRKVLEAYDAGEGTLDGLAERFRVSQGWVRKISAARLRTGKMERVPGAKRGPASKITPAIRTFITEAVNGKPDTTLAELQLRLFEEKQLEVSIGRLWSVLDELKLRFKKNSTRG
jgi:transposase